MKVIENKNYPEIKITVLNPIPKKDLLHLNHLSSIVIQLKNSKRIYNGKIKR